MEPALTEQSLRTNDLEKVPEVGVEPTHPKVHEFESCASANSATPASGLLVYFGIRGLSMALPPALEPQ